ncbi:SDR family oxidoreductase [Methylomonas rapida]|uniref:SDR family oxidoreductase n=1 Tax=Methylomonas rapida TaxID=2963939 RepID=A0ABY7GQR5_9GAMM|nr:SDR family oxidoreductase [Methylomonas rapida]WAR46854.1 SDR family oxidoreductase [Methylomonas rapida]
MQTIMVTGANRGLGLEFCRQYAQAGWRVIAACRNPADAAELVLLAERLPNIRIEALDVADFGQIDALSTRLADEAIDVLLNNAGIYPDRPGMGFGCLDYQAWSDALKINAMAAVKLAETLLPQIERSQRKLIVGVSSLMASMTDNQSGGSLLYRSSKAALNAAMKSLSIDLRARSVGVLILHPGWVKTDMGGKDALIDVEESVTGMRECIAGFTMAQSGAFLKYDGSVLPW